MHSQSRGVSGREPFELVCGRPSFYTVTFYDVGGVSSPPLPPGFPDRFETEQRQPA